MPSQRITYNPSANPNSGVALEVRRVVSNFQEGRKGLDELKRLLDKYNGDFVTLSVDLGTTDATSAQSVYNLVAQSQAEVCGLVGSAVGIGQVTGIRQLVDALG